MKFDDAALFVFLLGLYFVASHGIDEANRNDGAYRQAGPVYHARSVDGAALLRTGGRH